MRDVVRQHRVRTVESSADVTSGVVGDSFPHICVLILGASGPGTHLIHAVTGVATHVAAAEPGVDRVLL